MSWTKSVHKQQEKGINYREIGDKFGVTASTACSEKVNTAGTDENLLTLVTVPKHGARILPLELVPMPGYGAQISAREPTKGFVQTGATGTKSEQGLTD